MQLPQNFAKRRPHNLSLLLRPRISLDLALCGIHLFLSAIMVWLAWALAQAGETFANPAFAAFAAHGSESDWALRFLAAGAVGLVGLETTRDRLRLICVALLCCAHLTVAYCFWLATPVGGPIATGTGSYALIALLGFFLLICRLSE